MVAARTSSTPVEGVNGHVNGQPKGALSKHASTPRKSSARRSWSKGLVGIATRLLVWYALLTALFRCPSSEKDLTDQSSRICRPYLTARSHVQPYLDPYYDTYAAPYVELARPYTDRLNTRVISPVSRFSKKSYDLYAAPRINQAKEYGLIQWKAIAVPKLQEAQARASQAYAVHLAPYVDEIHDIVEPHYGVAKENVAYINEKHVIPAVEFSKPIASQALAASQKFVIETAIPFSKSAWSSLVLFVDGTLWPTMASLYRQNVEPQLVLIGERLARYREGRRLQAAMDEVSVDHVPSETVATQSLTSAEPESTVEESPTSTIKEEAPSKSSMSSKEKIEAARPQVAKDLYDWQEKFAVAADKGSDDLKERIEEIMSGLIQSEIQGVAVGLVKSLDMSGDKEIEQVKSKILAIVEKVPKEADSLALESAESEVFGAIRESGATVKSHAQRLRQWYNTFDGLVNQRVHSVASSTIQVLDEIRDLGLQQIGMRWAWLDGITYKDWEKYHQLKRQFADWRGEVIDAAFQHERFEEAKTSANDIVAQGMDTAEKVATELMRLKEVAKWKIQAHDTSDNFETKAIPAAAVRAKDSVASMASGASKSFSEALGTSSQGTIESIVSQATGIYSDASSSLSSAVVPQGTSDTAGEPSSVVSVASSSGSDTMSEAADGTSQALDASSEKIEEPLSSASSFVAGGTPKTEKSASSANTLSEAMSSSLVDTVDAASGSRYIVPGAMAQSVKGSSGPVLDDIFEDDEQTLSEKVQSVADRYKEAVAASSSSTYGTPVPASESISLQASSLFSEAVRMAQGQYDRAKSVASAQVSGTPSPVHEEIFSSIESAYSGAVAQASDRLRAALANAESQYASVTQAVHGTFTNPSHGALESISSLASSNLEKALSQASEQYSSVKAAIGATPTPAHQQILNEAQRRYYEAVGIAHERYAEFAGAASVAVYGKPTPAYESAYSKASASVLGTSAPAYQSLIDAAQSKYSEASSIAASHLDNALAAASSAVGATSTPPAQSAIDKASSKYKEAIAAASGAFASASASASNAIYGPPAGSFESARLNAAENWQAIVSKASAQVYGQPTPFVVSVASQAGEYSSQATDVAAARYSAVQAYVSQLINGKEPGFTESVYSQLSSAYYTGYHIELASSASSYASEAYVSASSVVSTYFTPPPTLEAILSSANDQLNAAIDAASQQVYGSSKGYYEQATSTVAQSFMSAASEASEAIYGTPTGYAEAAQSSISAAFSSAQNALSEALFGTPTGTIESATIAAASAYASITSAAGHAASSGAEAAGSNYSKVSSAISSAIYGPEQDALESAQQRLATAVESAQARLAEFVANASEGAAEAISSASSSVEEFASSMSSAASSVVSVVRDEL